MGTTYSDIKGKIKRPEKTVFLCLRGDLQASFEDAERELAAARSRPHGGTLAGGEAPEITAAARKVQALQAEMREHSVTFRFRGLPRKAYSDLVAKHPPPQDADDKDADVDWETFPVALVAACAVDPALTEDEAGELADELTQAQWNAMYLAAMAVNRTELDIPNSFAASAVLASSKKSSK